MIIYYLLNNFNNNYLIQLISTYILVLIYFWQNEYNFYFYYPLNYAEVALTGCPLTFLADLSWAGVDSAPLFERTLNNYIKYYLLFSKELFVIDGIYRVEHIV